MATNEGSTNKGLDVAVIGRLHPLDKIALAARLKWLDNALPHQVIPEFRDDGIPWDEFLIAAGRGAGKSYLGIQWAFWKSWSMPGSTGVVLSGSHLDLTQTLLWSSSGWFDIVPRELISSFNRQEMTIHMMNGSKVLFRSVEACERLRGINSHWALCDEVAGWQRTQADIAYQLLRLANRKGDNPQILITSTPKPTSLFNHWRKKYQSGDESIIIRHASSYDNPHLASGFARTLNEMDNDSSFSRMEIYGQLLDPSDEAFFPIDKLKLWPAGKAFPKFEHLFLSLDCAFSEKSVKDSSYTACVIGGIFQPSEDSANHLMLIDVWQDKLGFPDLRERVIDAYQKSYGTDENNKPNKRIDQILVEDQASGKSLIQELRHINLPVIGMKTGSKDKTERAVVTTPIWFDKKIWIPESQRTRGQHTRWANEFVDQVTTFPNTPIAIGEKESRNDFVDAFTHLVKHLMDCRLLNVTDHVERFRRPSNKPAYEPHNPYAQ